MAGSSGALFAGASAGGVGKAGSVPVADFAGNPRQAAVVFETPFAEAPVVSYAVEVGGALRYNVNLLSVTAEGFTLDLGTDTVLDDLIRVWWSASIVPVEPVAPDVPAVQELDAFLLGHSLLNFEMPQMLGRFVEATDGATLDYDIAVGGGDLRS